MRALSRDQFTKYAGEQIAMADQLLALHEPGRPGWCSCGHELPCSVAAHATAERDRLRTQLALLDATTVLPVLAAAAQARPVPKWRRLLGSWR